MLALLLTTISSTPRLPLSFLPGTQSSRRVLRPSRQVQLCQTRAPSRVSSVRSSANTCHASSEGRPVKARGGVLHSRQRLPRASCLPGVPSSRRRPFVRRIRLLSPACTVRAGRMPTCCACAARETKECPSVPRQLCVRGDSVPTALGPPSAAHVRRRSAWSSSTRAGTSCGALLSVVARLAPSRRTVHHVEERGARCVLHMHHGSYRPPPVACRARQKEANATPCSLCARGSQLENAPPRHAAAGAAQDPSGRSDGAHLSSRRAAANLCLPKPCSEFLHWRASPTCAPCPKVSAWTPGLPRETRCVLPALISIHLAASWIVRFRFLRARERFSWVAAHRRDRGGV
ncbi:hypothetical protein DFH09DRAFT_1393768 [Mycena vulgaris]|nr:hypothetical protein DFH09DRAFT_1393768 [Mycena vulgaris]